MCNWIIPLVISGGCYGFADTLCDIVIHQEDEKKDAKVIHYDELNSTSSSITHSPEDPKEKKIKQAQHLSSIQTIFVCILVTYVAVFGYFTWIMFNHESYFEQIGDQSFLFQKEYNTNFYLALLSGLFSFLCYFYVLKAFESAPSTVILPLLQFPSIFIFIASSTQKYFFGQVWLESKMHIIAYILIFFGGLIPATNGNVSMVTTKKFWKQPFVKDAIISELCHGLYNMCISSAEEDIHSLAAYTEYFATTRIAFVLSFAAFLCFSSKWQEEVWRIRYVAPKAIYITIFAEVLTLSAYFSSAMAYQCYYQTGVVTAAESSLNQLLNLFSAYILNKFFKLGRDESSKGVKSKLISAFLIMSGLLLTA